ncbi:DUF983 domain-containing protein [Methylobacterium sp. BTF04]|uniref:DUF983 domain-containing protein n=1 Tax=Methylobacterium sp. BTF04 TaxID=2708300 RepID=UPI0013D67F5B|nr:DUF983 domain-containing protein [Methylobacterium sp. BTF04]NEU13812.1 DUF983 domain-containing protein [Methylobacterium sp. BTF04]
MTTSVEISPAERTGLVNSLARGFLGRCPHCGTGKIFGRFLKVRPDCEACGLALHNHRADDLPPYVVIFIVGHLVGYVILEMEMNYDVPLWFQLSFWPLFTLGFALILLQPVKGAVVGLQYALGMGGFATLPLGPSPASARPEDVQIGSTDTRTHGLGPA